MEMPKIHTRWADLRLSLHSIGSDIEAINRANGWNVLTPEEWGTEPYKVPAVIALITSELSEALEAYRKGDKANFAEELADAFIRLLDLAHPLGIDLATEVIEKLEKNRKRGFRHGGKRV